MLAYIWIFHVMLGQVISC